MRKKSAGLFSLVVAAGLGTTLGMPALSASAAPQVSQVAAAGATSQPDQVQSDDLPNPADEKKQQLREQAITDLLNGKGTVQHRGASTVVKVGTTKTVKSADRTGDPPRQPRPRTSTSSSPREDGQDLRHPRRVRQRARPAATRTRTPTRTPRADTFDGPLHNADPGSRTAAKDNSTIWQPNYDRQHYQQLYFGTARRRRSR